MDILEQSTTECVSRRDRRAPLAFAKKLTDLAAPAARFLRPSRTEMGLLVGLFVLLALLEVRESQDSERFSWPILMVGIEAGLLALLGSRNRRISGLIGEHRRSKRTAFRLAITYAVWMFLLLPLSLFVLIGDQGRPGSPVMSFSVIAVAPTLGGLVLAAAKSGNAQGRMDLIRVAQKFISATILFLFFVPLFFMVENLNGIDPNTLEGNPTAMLRGLYFWVSVPSFFLGISLFLVGLVDLVFALADLSEDAAT